TLSFANLTLPLQGSSPHLPRSRHCMAPSTCICASNLVASLATELAVDESLEMLGVAGSLHLDLGGSTLDLAQVVGGQLDGGCAEVLVQTLHSAGAGDRD